MSLSGTQRWPTKEHPLEQPTYIKNELTKGIHWGTVPYMTPMKEQLQKQLFLEFTYHYAYNGVAN